MIFKSAELTDVPELKKLWKEIFSDTDGYIDLFFEYKMKPDYTFIAVENDEIAGAVYSVYSPVVLSDGTILSALYMCGICTKPEYRGKGVAGTLIKNCESFAKNKNIDFCYLIPANLGLFDFYKRFGFEKATYIDKIEVPCKQGSLPQHKTGYCEELIKWYGKLDYPFKPQRGEKEFVYISKCYSETLVFPEGYMVIDEDDDTVYLMEQTFDAVENAKIYAGNKNKRLIVYKPTDSTGTPFAVVKKLNCCINLPECGYINLMLN